MSLPEWSYDDVGLHNKATDCWLVVDDHVYDVTPFVPHHPGGNMIYLNAGRESTRLFESYHPSSVKSIPLPPNEHTQQGSFRKVLGKYLIGKVKGTSPYRVKFADDEADRALYDRIKAKVSLYFRKKGINPRFSWRMYSKTVAILASYVVAYYLTLFAIAPFWACLVSAVVMGFFAAEVGVSIQHDANHGAFHPNASVNKWVGTTLDFVGASSFIWKQQHVFGHHVYTNINSIDPDIRVKDPDVRRATPFQPWRRYQVYQHLYLGLLYGLLAIKSIFVDDFLMLKTKKIGAIIVNHCHAEELIVFFTGKIFFFFYYLIVPLLYSHHSFPALLALWLAAQFTTGWVLAFMFQVNHVTEDVDFYEMHGDRLTVGWTRSQIEGTSDFSHGSWFWTNVSGGLNYQVVHHLFPGYCHMYYPEIAPIIKDVCREEGIKYVIYPSFFSAVMSHLSHMKRIGKGRVIN